MSATARDARRAGPAVLSGAALTAAALWAAWAAPWQAGIAARGGTDLTALVAAALPMAPAPSAWAASWFGAPALLGAALLAGQRRPLLGAAVGLAACLNPLALHAYASGWGLGAVGLFVLAAQLVALPDRPDHRGQPLLGAGAMLAAASVPGAPSLALPFFAVLFLAARRPWAGGTMRALYLTAFAMPAAWFATLAYMGARGGAIAVQGAPGDLWHFALGTGLAAACAPGLVAEARARPEGLAVLGLASFAFIAPGVPDTLAVFTAWSGGAAACLRHGGAARICGLAVGTSASAGAVALLA